jgi:hypothetical protein
LAAQVFRWLKVRVVAFSILAEWAQVRLVVEQWQLVVLLHVAQQGLVVLRLEQH